MIANQDKAPAELAALTCSAKRYRLALKHPLWPREIYGKWQESPDFTKALKKSEELGVTARVESQNVQADTRHE